MSVAEKFVKNLKVLSGKSQFTQTDLTLIFLVVQEMGTLSPVEFMSLIDNLDVSFEEGEKEMPKEEFETLSKELLEE